MFNYYNQIHIDSILSKFISHYFSIIKIQKKLIYGFQLSDQFNYNDIKINDFIISNQIGESNDCTIFFHCISNMKSMGESKFIDIMEIELIQSVA